MYNKTEKTKQNNANSPTYLSFLLVFLKGLNKSLGPLNLLWGWREGSLHNRHLPWVDYLSRGLWNADVLTSCI